MSPPTERAPLATRWYSTVVDSRDPIAQARWWAKLLEWQVIHETPEEAIIIPGYVTEEKLRATPWDEVGPGLVFVGVPDEKEGKNRLHLDLAPHLDDDREAEIDRLLSLGAVRVDVGQSADATHDVFADPEGNEFCLLSSRDS